MLYDQQKRNFDKILKYYSEHDWVSLQPKFAQEAAQLIGLNYNEFMSGVTFLRDSPRYYIDRFKPNNSKLSERGKAFWFNGGYEGEYNKWLAEQDFKEQLKILQAESLKTQIQLAQSTIEANASAKNTNESVKETNSNLIVNMWIVAIIILLQLFVSCLEFICNSKTTHKENIQVKVLSSQIEVQKQKLIQLTTALDSIQRSDQISKVVSGDSLQLGRKR